MSKKVKVLLVGASFSADLHADAYARLTDVAEIVAICDKATDRIPELAARYNMTDYKIYDDFEKAIDEVDCDVVDVCLPNFLHKAAALKAFSAGKNVISEKPLATTYEDAQEMVEAAQKAGKHLFYAEDWLFAPALHKALDIIDEGGIGETKYIRARECHNGSHSPFAQTLKFCGGGSLTHLGVHPVCFMLALKNNRWTELTAMTSGGLENNMVHKQMEGEDWAVLTMKFEDGTTATLEANYVTVGGMEDVIDFYGTDGCMHVDLTFSSAIRCFSEPGLNYTVEKADVKTGWSRPAVDEKFNLGYVNEIRHFMECARDDKDAKVGLRGVDGLEALRVIRLAYQSSKEGIAIKNDKLS